ncbi:MAG: hypothetical protein A3A04_00645 [Candidatus Harrisonbacteria bacterium RIFCSPLOWO2_01_FULL_40_28]|uniref:NADP-dependent oxidoreductase domain-containing protein n=2 Tax=Candidatus Harrisoniibacteriota TaxID=1817905 RepID=A0A1G1ZVD8_9BACT|nr:MAG: hypothetical protein A3A04_00645 [Candidatus Harrisonbacteria bacterium RIFCSPLOWO2_01_FULL_40_28]OGY68435.1 MAG: hypothetical protein A2586_01020 [Candidatus Harrisonbacteria bacterium RIFOXYD1_FULL_40_9]
MRYKALGRGEIGIKISEIGFGTWGIGGLSRGGATSYGKTDDNESKRALQCAYDSGINFYDTSNIYGDGHSEELLGEVFKNRRDRIVIATKVGFVEHLKPQDFSINSMTESLDGSLRRLRTDYVDICQLHSPSLDQISLGVISEFVNKLKSQGKIRMFGISVKSPKDCRSAVLNFGAEILQVNFNMIDQRALDFDIFEFVNKLNIGLVLRTPLCFGFLSGKCLNAEFGSDDHRSRWPKEQLDKWREAPNFFIEIAKKMRLTLSQLAFRFCLDQVGTTTVIPGMITVEEVMENASVSNTHPLGPIILSEIRNIYLNHSFFIAKPK